MRFLLSVVATLIFSPLVLVSAQQDVDIAVVAEEVSAVDSERLLMGLNTPIADDALPTGFTGARAMNPTTLAEQRGAFNEAFDGLNGSVVYTIDYQPVLSDSSPEGSASPSATPGGGAPQAIFSSSTLTYLVFAETVDVSDIDAFATSLQTAMGSEAQQGTVEQVTLGETPAVMISAVTVVNGVDIHTQWIGVPVGKVVVVGMVMTGSGAFSEGAFIQDNEALVLSGIAWLGSALDD